MIFYDKLMELINQLDIPEVPTIPLHVSKVIEIMKEAEANGELPIGLQKDNEKITKREVKKAQEWALNNYTEYTEAYANGYELEEQKYIVKLPEVKRAKEFIYLLKTDDGLEIDWSPLDYIIKHLDTYAFTEKEIIDIDPRYMDFAIPVDDLDE